MLYFRHKESHDRLGLTIEDLRPRHPIPGTPRALTRIDKLATSGGLWIK